MDSVTNPAGVKPGAVSNGNDPIPTGDGNSETEVILEVKEASGIDIGAVNDIIDSRFVTPATIGDYVTKLDEGITNE